MIPEEGYELVDDQGARFACEGGFDGWSTPLATTGGAYVEGSRFTWATGGVLRDSAGKATFRMAPATARILVSAASEGLPDLVEIQQLPKGTPFTLLVRSEDAGLIERWGASDCKEFRRVPVAAGLPPGWQVYQAQAALDDTLVKAHLPQLELPTAVRLRATGGVRTGRGSEYFAFAPPGIVLEGAGSEVQVYCNGTALAYDSVAACYRLPRDAPTGARLAVEARQGHDVLYKQAVYLAAAVPLPPARNSIPFDQFGRRLAPAVEGATAVAGACAMNIEAPPFDFAQAGPAPGSRPAPHGRESSNTGPPRPAPGEGSGRKVQISDQDLHSLLAIMRRSRQPMTLGEMCERLTSGDDPATGATREGGRARVPGR